MVESKFGFDSDSKHKMGFLVGEAPIRRTLKYLNAGKIVFKDKIKIFTINYNDRATNHLGAK